MIRDLGLELVEFLMTEDIKVWPVLPFGGSKPQETGMNRPWGINPLLLFFESPIPPEQVGP